MPLSTGKLLANMQRSTPKMRMASSTIAGIDAAVAIFDSDGRVLSANRAFEGIWGAKAAESLRGYLDLWRRIAADSPGYQSLRRALASDRGDAPLQGAIAGPDRSILSWRVRPLSAGRRMVQFAAAYPDERIVVSLIRQLSWTHFIALIPLKDPLQRDYYAQMASAERWSVRTLRERIDSMQIGRASCRERV